MARFWLYQLFGKKCSVMRNNDWFADEIDSTNVRKAKHLTFEVSMVTKRHVKIIQDIAKF